MCALPGYERRQHQAGSQTRDQSRSRGAGKLKLTTVFVCVIVFACAPGLLLTIEQGSWRKVTCAASALLRAALTARPHHHQNHGLKTGVLSICYES